MKTPKNSQVGRSVLAVGAGFVSIALASHGLDALLRAAGLYPGAGQTMSDGMFACAALYRTLFGVLGCYLSARLAPQHAERHAMILGVIGTLLAALGAIATWNKGPELGPHWYPISLVLTALPAAWIATRLHNRTTPTLARASA